MASSVKKSREKWNFKPWLIVGGVVLAIVAGILLKVYVVDDLLARQRFDKTETGYRNRRTGDEFLYAPPYYVADSILQQKDRPPYGICGKTEIFRVGYTDHTPEENGGKAKLSLSSAGEWLATRYDLLYNPARVAVPEPADFDPEYMYLGTPGDRFYAETAIDTGTSRKLLADFFSAPDGENLYGGVEMERAVLFKTVHVTSETCRYIHLVMYLYRNGSSYYLYVPSLERFVETDGSVIEIYTGKAAQ